jgi:Tol biopolymer transport system component
MNDSDKTIYSGRGAAGNQPAPPPAKKRNPLLLIGGIGCVLLLCLLALAGVGLFLARDRLSDVVASLGDNPFGRPTATEVLAVESGPTGELPVDTPTVMTTVEISPTLETPALETVTTEPAPTALETSTPLAIEEPKIGPLTFALGVTPDNVPISPTLSFQEGITEVHAIFEYSGMSPTDTWERVWYLDQQEILRTAEPWSGDKSGTFDYFVNAGGDPLSPGNWTLELYVGDQQLAQGSFTITAQATPAVAQAATITATPTPANTSTPAAAAPTSEPGPTPTPKPSGGGVYRLAYTRWDGGQHNLYIADTNGNNDQFILKRAAGPSWTPDGRYLFFFGEAGVDHQDRQDQSGVGSCELPTVSDGIVSLLVSQPPNDICIAFPKIFQDLSWKEGTARWANVSPDGTMVAYDAKPGGSWRIYFLGTNTNQQFRYEIVGEQGDWAPNSQKLVYRSGRDGQTGIWISNRDDTDPVRITDGGSDSFPAWSPDGNTIVFSRDEGGNVDIYSMNVDGSNLTRLTDAPGVDTLPTYTPSGDIIFRSARNGAWGIWKMSSDGSNQQQIIANAPVGPDWAYSRMDVVK